VREATSGEVRLSDAEQQILAIPELYPSATLNDLANAIIGNRACGHWFTPDSAEAGVWELTLPEAPPQLVSFDRDAVDASKRDVALLTWGTAEAEALASQLDITTTKDNLEAL
jgi:hypothetical protein